MKLFIIFIAIINMVELNLALQQFVYSPYKIANNEKGVADDDTDVDAVDEDYMGQEIYKFMDDMIVDKRKEVFKDPCQCPFKIKEFYVSNLTTPNYQRGKECDKNSIKHQSSSKHMCMFGTSCRQVYFKLRFNENPSKPNQFSTVDIPIDCRCLSSQK